MGELAHLAEAVGQHEGLAAVSPDVVEVDPNAVLPRRTVHGQHRPQRLRRLIQGVEAGVAIADGEPGRRQQPADHAQLVDGPAQLCRRCLRGLDWQQRDGLQAGIARQEMVVYIVVIGAGEVCRPGGVLGVREGQAEGGIEHRLADARIVHELRPARGVVAVPPWGQATPPAVQSREQVIGAERFLRVLPPEVRHQVLVPLIDMSIAVNDLSDHMCGSCACGCHGRPP